MPGELLPPTVCSLRYLSLDLQIITVKNPHTIYWNFKGKLPDNFNQLIKRPTDKKENETKLLRGSTKIEIKRSDIEKAINGTILPICGLILHDF